MTLTLEAAYLCQKTKDTVTRWARLLPGQMEMTTPTSQSYANKIDNSTKHYVHGI